MKSIFTILLTSGLIFSILAFSTTAFAAKQQSDNQLYTQCKTNVLAQLDDVKKTRLVNLKRRGAKFTAKMRVTTARESGLYLCTIDPNQGVNIARLGDRNSDVARNK